MAEPNHPEWEQPPTRLTSPGGPASALTGAGSPPEATPPAPGQSMPPQELPLQVGRYVIEGEVGRGGMGVVLRGRDPELNRTLAVKLLLDRYRGRPDIERRFLEEERVTAQLQHPGVPPVHEVGSFGDGR